MKVDDNKRRREVTEFLILSMAGTTAAFWGPCDEERNSPVRKVDFPGGHSKILKSAESRKWTAPQTCDKNERPHREAKPPDPDELREW